jgi:hypothetical protein
VAFVGGWSEWARNLAELYRVYQRPAEARGMVTDNELCFLETYARYSYTGAGKIVDLGCWLGATTLALARGVVDNQQQRWERPIYALDRFRWEPWMTPIAESIGCPCYLDGDSFLERTRTTLKQYENLISLRSCDLLVPIDFADPIEFLFVDAMKSWDLANAIVQGFFPHLVAGRSLVVQQDFAYHHPVGATNHVLMWLLRDFMTPVYHVPGSCSVVFFVHRALRKNELPWLNPASVSKETARQAWEQSLGIVGNEAKRDVHLCKVLFFIERGWLHEASQEAQMLVASAGAVTGPAVKDIRDLIHTECSRRLPVVDGARLASLETLLLGEARAATSERSKGSEH